MRSLIYFLTRIIAKVCGDEAFSCLFRRYGMKVGRNCRIYSNIMTSESYLITVGDNVTISNNVQLITHDNSVCKLIPDKTDIFGEIHIGNNSFIGTRSIIMYGVTLPDNTIVAAGSVVTKSFKEEGIIIGGNPARQIGRYEKLKEKSLSYAINIGGMSESEKRIAIQQSKKVIR